MKTKLPAFPLFDASQIAELFQVKPITVLKWVERGQIPYIKMSDKCLRFDIVEIVRLKKNVLRK